MLTEIRPTSASFLLTENCNLACKYCFEMKNRDLRKDMTPDVAERGIRYLFENAVKQGENRVNIMLFGGEPLLKPELCDLLLKKGLDLSEKTGIKFGARIITNATVMNERIELMLYRWASSLPLFTCQLSIDGAEKSQNLYRVHPNGTGSWEAAARNIPTFLNIFKENGLNIHGCVNKQTLPLLYENYRYLMEHWVKNENTTIWYMPIHTEDWELSDVEEYDRQLSQIFEHVKAAGKPKVFSPLNKCITVNFNEQPKRPCGAGVGFISITGDGELYPCHNIYFNDPKKITRCGSLFENDGVLDIEVVRPFAEYTTKDLRCGNCQNVHCYRCIADNWSTYGDITKQVGIPIRCAMSSVERKYQMELKKVTDEYENRQKKLAEVKASEQLSQRLAVIEDSMKLLLLRQYDILLPEAAEQRTE